MTIVLLYVAVTEDILWSAVAHYWSPDAGHLCYAEIDSTEVPYMEWPIYGDYSDVYGRTEQIKYPKVIVLPFEFIT